MNPLPACAAALLWSAASVAAEPVVATEAGAVRGVSAGGVLSFRGIPFAAPPVGALRWRAPQKPAPWEVVRAATAYGHDCMQEPFGGDAAPPGTAVSEDCLTLNVWRPADGARDLPVLVWIYGGGFVNGGASAAIYAGDALARQGLVVVSFNYRLGRFGFFAHPALTGAHEDGGVVGNYGFLDQIAALQWVQRNIAAFGGNPHDVTVEGESAGGMSVHMLLTSPRAAGLFARAVIQSGGDGRLLQTTPHEAEQAGAAFAHTKGIAPDDPAALAKLRALPAAALVDGLNMGVLFNPPPGPATWTFPIVDGAVSIDAGAAYRDGRFAHVPVMVGATSDDLFGADGPMMRGSVEVADMLAAHGVPVFAFRFSYVASTLEAAGVRAASHATDIPYFLGTTAIHYGPHTTARDLAAERTANGYLVNFIRHGDPNGPGLPAWPRWRAGGGGMLDLDAAGGAAIRHD